MEQQALGFNYRLSDVHSALGLSQLAKLDRFLDRRNEIAERYRDGLGDLEQLTLAPEPEPGERHGRHLYVIVAPRRRAGAAAAVRRAARAGDPRAGALPPGIPSPLLPGDLRVRARALPAGGDATTRAACRSPAIPALTAEQQDPVIAAVRELA